LKAGLDQAYLTMYDCGYGIGEASKQIHFHATVKGGFIKNDLSTRNIVTTLMK